MGYTNYWQQTRAFTNVEWDTICSTAGLIIRNARKGGMKLANKDGDMGTTPHIDRHKISLNGRPPCEKFELLRVPPPSRHPDAEGPPYQFCKTEHLPYDSVVVAILLVASQVAPDAITVTSDK